MPEKPKPLKFESLQKLITNAEGKRATYEGSRKMPNGDLEKFKKLNHAHKVLKKELTG